MRELATQFYAYVVAFGDSTKIEETMTKLTGNLSSKVRAPKHRPVQGNLTNLANVYQDGFYYDEKLT
jgi:hypothetical protein